MAWIDPIYDRTSEDVDNLKALATAIRAVGWDNATLDQKTQWLTVATGVTKGALNALDLNRIDGNIVFLRDWLASDYGFNVIIDESNPTWDNTLTPLLSDMNRIRDNVYALINGSYIPPTAPIIEYTANPNWDDINDIEKVLFDLYELLERVRLTWVYCGSFNCGQGDIL